MIILKNYLTFSRVSISAVTSQIASPPRIYTQQTMASMPPPSQQPILHPPYIPGNMAAAAAAAGGMINYGAPPAPAHYQMGAHVPIQPGPFPPPPPPPTQQVKSQLKLTAPPGPIHTHISSREYRLLLSYLWK